MTGPRGRYPVTASFAVLAGLLTFAGCGGDERSIDQNPPKVRTSGDFIETDPGLVMLIKEPSSVAGPGFKFYVVSLDNDAPNELVEQFTDDPCATALGSSSGEIDCVAKGPSAHLAELPGD